MELHVYFSAKRSEAHAEFFITHLSRELCEDPHYCLVHQAAEDRRSEAWTKALSRAFPLLGAWVTWPLTSLRIPPTYRILHSVSLCTYTDILHICDIHKPATCSHADNSSATPESSLLRPHGVQDGTQISTATGPQAGELAQGTLGGGRPPWDSQSSGSFSSPAVEAHTQMALRRTQGQYQCVWRGDGQGSSWYYTEEGKSRGRYWVWCLLVVGRGCSPMHRE